MERLDSYAYDVIIEISKRNNENALLKFILHLIKLSNLKQYNNCRTEQLETELVKKIIHHTPYKLVLK